MTEEQHYAIDGLTEARNELIDMTGGGIECNWASYRKTPNQTEP